MKKEEILKLKFDSDLGNTTIKHYLKELISELWREEEGFSGKRPFGNSGWQGDIAVPLLENGVIKGYQDEDGYWDYTPLDVDNVVLDLIDYIFE